MWFGKKDAMETIRGVGGWIDEQQLTQEEQIKYKLHLFEIMGPFKQIQRIIVTWVMIHWIGWAANCMIALWLGQLFPELTAFEKLVDYASLEMVWAPSLGVFTLYLSGGVAMFGKKK